MIRIPKHYDADEPQRKATDCDCGRRTLSIVEGVLYRFWKMRYTESIIKLADLEPVSSIDIRIQVRDYEFGH